MNLLTTFKRGYSYVLLIIDTILRGLYAYDILIANNNLCDELETAYLDYEDRQNKKVFKRRF